MNGGPTKFHIEIKKIREQLGFTLAEFGNLVNPKWESPSKTYHQYESNSDDCPITYVSEKIISALVENLFPETETDHADKRLKKIAELRKLEGYDAPIEQVLDNLTGEKTPPRTSFAELFHCLKNYRKLSFEEMDMGKNNNGDSIRNKIFRTSYDNNPLSEMAGILERCFGIKRDAEDKTGASVVTEFLSQAKAAEIVLAEYKPDFGKALFAHKLFQGGTRKFPNLTDRALTRAMNDLGSEIGIATLSAIVNTGRVSFSLAQEVVDFFNLIRGNNAPRDATGQRLFEMRDIDRDILTQVGAELGEQVNHDNLSFVQFVAVGRKLAERYPELQTEYNIPPAANIELIDTLSVIRGFLGITNDYIEKGSGMSLSSSRSKTSRIEDSKISVLLKNLELKNIPDAKKLASEVKVIEEFNQKHFNTSVLSNLKLKGMTSRGFQAITGINSTAKKATSSLVRRVAEFFTEEREAEVKAFQDYAQKTSGEKSAKFTEHLSMYSAYNDDKTRKAINAEVVSDLPAEVILYDRTAKINEEFAKAWTPEIRDKFIKICKYRSEFLYCHPEAISAAVGKK